MELFSIRIQRTFQLVSTHRWKFDIKNDIFRVEKHPMDSGKLMLTINRQPIVQWFKEQWEKLQQNLRNSVQREQKSRGFRI